LFSGGVLLTDLEIMSNKALLTTLKKETEAGEII